MLDTGKPRYLWLDVMKLIGIWLVYMTHYDGMGRYGLIGQTTLLGILFFASGFSASECPMQPVKIFVQKRFRQLIVPYFTFGMLTLAVRVFLFELSLGEMIQWTKRLLWGVRNICPVAALWFLPCLFVMGIYHQLIYRLVRRPLAVLAVAGAVSLAVKLIHEGPVLPWGLDMAGRFWVYYALGDAAGLWYRRRVRKNRPFSHAEVVAAGTAAGVSWAVCYINFYFGLNYFPSLMGVDSPSYITLSLLTFLYQCCGIVAALSVSFALQRVRLFCEMGRSTLVLCGTEQITKVVVPLLFSAAGLSIPDTGTIVGANVMAIQAFLMMLFGYFFLARPIQRHMPWLLGYTQSNRKGEYI